MTDNPFDTHAIGNYAESTPKKVPGFDGLHRMTSMLLAEKTPPNGRVLVLGAGGGLELEYLAKEHPHWSFDGIDPSANMLDLAKQKTALYSDRTHLHHGYINDAPSGPFDAALSLLTFHFIPHDQRLTTLKEIHARLKKDAPLVIAHISFPQTEPERSQWIARHVAYTGTAQTNTESARQAISTKLTILSPQEEELMLQNAGFKNVSLFYAGLSFKGWVAYA